MKDKETIEKICKHVAGILFNNPNILICDAMEQTLNDLEVKKYVYISDSIFSKVDDAIGEDFNYHTYSICDVVKYYIDYILGKL